LGNHLKQIQSEINHIKEDSVKNCVLITGCSSGIGRAAAFHFQEQGWSVAATMRSPQNETELNQFENVMVESLDITSRKSIDLAVGNTVREFGKIDVLVNNAGIGIYSVFEEVSEDVIRESFEVNVFGTMQVIRVILPYFRMNRNGRIINVTSTLPQLGAPMTTLYCATKMAIEGLSRALYYELLPLGIRVILVQPGSTKTNIAMQHEFPNQVQNSDYLPLSKTTIERFQHRFETETLSPPEEPARVIYKAATSRSPRFRYVSGRDAKLANLMKRLLPEHTLLTLASRMMGTHNIEG
jgi:NAD(P)-dependent dehydrogenase (short-subunit alcohol dehydrogenase family)